MIPQKHISMSISTQNNIFMGNKQIIANIDDGFVDAFKSWINSCDKKKQWKIVLKMIQC